MIAQLDPPIRAVILDMDGVLWAGKQALIDIPAAFQKMNDLDLKVILATNNATQTAAQFVEKVRSFGVELGPEQIINSPMAVADILEQRFPVAAPSTFLVRKASARPSRNTATTMPKRMFWPSWLG